MGSCKAHESSLNVCFGIFQINLLDVVLFAVNEVSVEELRSYTSLGRTDMYVNCHYNLLPVVQPKWFNPDGVEITDGKKLVGLFVYVAERIRAPNSSSGVSVQ